MATTLDEGDEERTRFVETLTEFERLAHGIRAPSCVQIFERPLREVQLHLGCGLRPLVTQMHQHLTYGGELSKVDEQRENWRGTWQFHFDLWPEFGGREIYIETRFVDSNDLDDRVVFIVNIHPPRDFTWSTWKN